MAKTRVHDLAKEYGMTSKEMLGHLAEMKIPAKSPSSTLEDAYVSIVRKKLKPILEARAAEIEAQKRAEAEAKAEKEHSTTLPSLKTEMPVVPPPMSTTAPSVVPMFVGQRYHDTTNKKVYEAFAVTNSTVDWTLLN